MTLKEARVGAVYIVSFIDLDKATMRRLEALGLTRGTALKILNRSRQGSVILMVRGSRLALGSRITETIHAKEKGVNYACIIHTQKFVPAFLPGEICFGEFRLHKLIQRASKFEERHGH